jgi:uncharacterized membrane protein
MKTSTPIASEPSSQKKIYLVILILALIGVFNAAYLSYHAYGFWFGANADALRMLPCDISATFSCSDILSNPRSLVFGIPFPMVALIVYPILSIIALIGWMTRTTCPAKILTGLSAGGICFNSYVIYQESIVGVWCPLCAMCTVIIVTIFVLSIMIWKKKERLS